MPVIELPEEPPGGGCETYGTAIVSVMLYPRKSEAALRRNWRAAAAAYAYSDFRAKGAPWQMLAAYHGWIGDLWKLPQAPARVFKDGTARMRRASLSGNMLEFLLRLAVHHPVHCRVERAKLLIIEALGRRAPSESLLEKVWPDFKTVAPLWLAFRTERAISGGMRNNAAWLAMLARAETYRSMAVTRRILVPEETWRADPALSLPTVEIDIQPLPKALLSILDRDFPV